jgi:hypothetical protein
MHGIGVVSGALRRATLDPGQQRNVAQCKEQHGEKHHLTNITVRFLFNERQSHSQRTRRVAGTMRLSLPGGTLSARAKVMMPRKPLNHNTTWSLNPIFVLRN